MSGAASLVLDTNIIIYYLKGHETTKALILDNQISISFITEIEILRYKDNTDEDIRFIQRLFSTFTIVEMNDRIKESAIQLGRSHKLKTPDSIIAATSLYLDMPLVTHDSDFFRIPYLTTIDFSL